MKKTLKKPVLKAIRKGKALGEEVPEDTDVGRDKGSRTKFWGEYADGVNEEANGDSLKKGSNFVVTLALMKLKSLMFSYYLAIYLRDILTRRS